MEPVAPFAAVFAHLDDHLAAIRQNANCLAAAAAAAGLDAMTTTCPGWSVRDVVTHTGGVHRWAAANVANGSVSDAEVADMFAAPADSELLSWFAEGYAELITVLSKADPDIRCFTFLPNASSPLAFWGRRQAHETAIHRVDVESALGGHPDFETAFAVDGIDELINGFLARPGGRLRSDPPVSMQFTPTDAPAAWHVTIGPEARDIVTSSAPVKPADVTVRGRASDLYLLLWNRGTREGLAIDGDESLLDLWRDTVNVRWR